MSLEGGVHESVDKDHEPLSNVQAPDGGPLHFCRGNWVEIKRIAKISSHRQKQAQAT
jgi:hypothetical protein